MGDFPRYVSETMYRGASTLNLDAKGRLAMPSAYRDELIERCDGKLVITVNNTRQQCLWMYPMDEWEIVEKRVAALPSFKPSHQKLKRFFIGYASDVGMDKSGRLLIPGPLREFANLDKEVFLVGQSNKFEIWNGQLWKTGYEEWMEEDTDSSELSAELAQMTL